MSSDYTVLSLSIDNLNNEFLKGDNKMETVLSVEGMSCEHCERHVKNALEEINGVQSAKASHVEKKVVIEHENDVNIEELIAAIVEVGYETV
jgi:copper chaperone CopZ